MEAKGKVSKGKTSVFPGKAIYTWQVLLCNPLPHQPLPLRQRLTNPLIYLLFFLIPGINGLSSELFTGTIHGRLMLHEYKGSTILRLNNQESASTSGYVVPTLTGLALPLTFDVTGGGDYCSGGSGVSIALSGSETGVSYELHLGGAPTGTTLPGTGNALTFINITPSGTYTILATDELSLETALMNGSATITILSNPDPPVSGGNQTICSNQSIPSLSVSVGSGETADWYSIASGGTPLATGTTTYTPTGAGNWYAEARNATTSCTSNSRTCITLTINTQPTVSAIPDNQSICPDTEITQINITNPNNVPGTTFSWVRDNTTTLTGIEASGSGSSISGTLHSQLPNTLQTTNFTITATANACSGSTTTDITAGDITPPVITCPVPAPSYNTDAGQCFASLGFTATATDNCGIQHVKYYIGAVEITFPHNFPVGSSVVTATATDLSGNTADCTFAVIVIDNELPFITCPSSPQNLFVIAEVALTPFPGMS